ncbi:MAG: hypothetical protein IT423_04905, partial [Pirellulaceae bacterium]|nr:hypothetical protein [Pirellulaceae bacterium]
DLPPQWGTRPKTIEVTTVDGDGVAVTYRQPIPWPASDAAAAPLQDATRSRWCMITIGRADRPIMARVLDQSGQPLQSLELTEEQLGQALPTTQAWMVAIGSSLGVEATSFSVAETGLSNFTTTVLTSASELPDSWRGLAGCDVLIIATTNSSPSPQRDPSASAVAQTRTVVADMNHTQWQAIDDWIQHGGTGIISLGQYATELTADNPLLKLLPGQIVDHLVNIDTSPLEDSTATTIQLAPITATRLKNVRGVVELTMQDNTSKRFPWWVRYSQGKGVIHFLGSDMDQPVLKQWKDRRLIWEKVLTAFWARNERNDSANTDRNVSGTSDLGYDDLTGQLRATLDYFPTTRVYSFGTIAAILAGLLIIIGPLDYWVSVRWLRRPSVSWWFSGTVIAASSLGLIWLEQVSRPRELLLNSAQVVDFLPEQNRLLVDCWTHVYSSRARTIDAQLRTPGSVAQASRLDWQGLPGKGLGGMESNLLTDQSLPRYAIEVTSQHPADRPEQPVAMTGVGIPASGTKCLYATWSAEFQPQGESQLTELKGIDQVQGLLVNPLPYDILRPVLTYHNWAYSLPSRLRAGEELTVTYEMVPKDLMRRLNRRQIVGTNDTVTRWVADDRQSLDRLLEIMMFYKASGGLDYSKLTHRFQPRIDVSHALALDHAVLYGELAVPLGQILPVNVPEDQIKQESGSTWCRVLLPVARAEE